MRISQMRLNFNLSLKLLLDLIIYQLTLKKHFITVLTYSFTVLGSSL